MPTLTQFDENHLQLEIAIAKEAARDLCLAPNFVSALAYGFFRYREITDALIRGGCGGRYPHVVLDVSRLIGEHLALEKFAQGDGPKPEPTEATLRQLQAWRDWATVLLADRGLEPTDIDGGSDSALQMLLESRLRPRVASTPDDAQPTKENQ